MQSDDLRWYIAIGRDNGSDTYADGYEITDLGIDSWLSQGLHSLVHLLCDMESAYPVRFRRYNSELLATVTCRQTDRTVD